MTILRSPWLAGAVLFALLLLAGPLFVRQPVWVDVTYHDVSAWNVLHGGTHYRDVFETNLPGMVWVHAVLRPLIGWGQEAIRLADLAVLAAIIFLLTRFARELGATVSQRLWLAVAVALFYLFETEFIHVQRDGWMLLPATLAAWLRCRQLKSPSLVAAVLEGLCWGAAVWVKPHVLVPALLVWLVSWNFVPRRAMLLATVGLIVGGLLAGAAGSAWLVSTGTWGPMWDVLLNWNGEYYQWTVAGVLLKIRLVVTYFPPFSLLHFVAVPLAVIGLFRRRPDLAARGVLCALYLGWLAQAAVIQKEFDYAHSPPTILGLAVLACHWLPVGPVFLAWCLLGSAVTHYAGEQPLLQRFKEAKPFTHRLAVPEHPVLDPARLALWGRAWADDSMDLKDKLTYYHNIHCAPDWADLKRAEEFLRSKKVGDRDVICWHDATHPLYVWLDIRPGLRYPHVMTAMKFRSKLPVIRAEAFASPAKYAVADVVPCGYLIPGRFPPPPPPGPIDRLPDYFPEWGATTYPWNQRPVYRAGRYFVFEITAPRGEIDFPLPEALKD